MAASDWIPCRIHPDHPKVLALAALTGDDPATVCGKVIGWFWHVDQNHADADTKLDRKSFLIILKSIRKRKNRMDYYEAMAEKSVSWISHTDRGTVRVTEYENNFSESSKRRANNYLRVKRHRAKASGQSPESATQALQMEAENVTGSVTQGATERASKPLPTNRMTIRNKQQGKGPVAAAADFSQGLPEPVVSALSAAGVSLNRRTQGIASQACKAWGDDAPAKIRAIANSAQQRGCGAGVVVEELDTRSAQAIERGLANAERNVRVRSSPAVGLTPEQRTRHELALLREFGWRRLRAAIRGLDLYRRPRLRSDAAYRNTVIRAAAAETPGAAGRGEPKQLKLTGSG